MSETLVFDKPDYGTRPEREYEGKHPHPFGKHPHACGKKPHPCGIAVNMVGLREFLTDRHPRKTAECVARDTGVPIKTVERWLYNNPAEPSGINMLRLFIAYRAPVLAAALEKCPDWLNDQAIEAKNAELDRRIADAKAQRAAVSGGDM